MHLTLEECLMDNTKDLIHEPFAEVWRASYRSRVAVFGDSLTTPNGILDGRAFWSTEDSLKDAIEDLADG